MFAHCCNFILFYLALPTGGHHNSICQLCALSLWEETNLGGNQSTRRKPTMIFFYNSFHMRTGVRVTLGKFSPRLEPVALQVKGRCANHFATETPKNNNNASIICFHHPWRAGNPGGIWQQILNLETGIWQQIAASETGNWQTHVYWTSRLAARLGASNVISQHFSTSCWTFFKISQDIFKEKNLSRCGRDIQKLIFLPFRTCFLSCVTKYFFIYFTYD
jgi:hypothetical protein